MTDDRPKERVVYPGQVEARGTDGRIIPEGAPVMEIKIPYENQPMMKMPKREKTYDHKVRKGRWR